MWELLQRGVEIVGAGRRPVDIEDISYFSLDITDRRAVKQVMETAAPDVVIHCAAWTQVDAAEKQRVEARAVNTHGTANIAEACRSLGSKLIYISTDYVFNGQGTVPWQVEDDRLQPLNWYGKTKLEGEMAVRQAMERFFLVRTAWLFGPYGNNFVMAMLRQAEKQAVVRVVQDQIGTPTYTRDLAVLLADMAESEAYGCYHAVNCGGYLSWYDFAVEIYRQAGITTPVIPVTAEEYGQTVAVRPQNSRLDTSGLAKVGFQPLPDWRDALNRYLIECKGWEKEHGSNQHR